MHYTVSRDNVQVLSVADLGAVVSIVVQKSAQQSAQTCMCKFHFNEGYWTKTFLKFFLKSQKTIVSGNDPAHILIKGCRGKQMLE